MIPLHDNNPTHSRPVVTIGLIAVNVLVFLFGWIQPDRGERFIFQYGYIPAALTYSADDVREALDKRAVQRQQLVVDRFGRPRVFHPPSYAEVATQWPALVKIITCMFLHGGWMHLLGNMLYLWIFGNNIEDRLGPPLFIVFYLVTGVLGTLMHTWIDPQGLVPLVGASGAISGVLGAYILLYPHARVTTLIPIGWYITTAELPAWIFLGIYAVLQVLNGLPALSHIGNMGGVAHWAHIGGFAAGLALIKMLPQRRFARPIPPPPPWTDDDDDDTGERGWVRY